MKNLFIKRSKYSLMQFIDDEFKKVKDLDLTHPDVLEGGDDQFKKTEDIDLNYGDTCCCFIPLEFGFNFIGAWSFV